MSVPWSVAMSESFMKQYPLVSDMPFQKRRCWNYENGCILTAFERMRERTGDDRYFRYIKENMDLFIKNDGSIDTYSLNEYNVDMINQGKTLFLLHRETGENKYRQAIELLVTQLKGHPRTSEGGLWHKKIYPFQMWLDGVYMTSPFLAQYAQTFGEHEWYDDVANEILLMERVSRDPRNGLLYHGWDESREQRWADKQTGCSPNFWGRALGWYVMAVVDVLDFLPVDHPKRGQVIGIFYRLAEAIMEMQDQESGLWYQVLDQGGREGNYLESSGSAMFACALTKGARKGYLGGSALRAARKAHQGLLDRYVERDADGSLHLNGICSVAGLGNKPYRDGSYDYYISEPTRRDDPKGFAPFVMACLEIEALPS
ncbi:Unsaturated rhamnogalacturonyl hydrolase YteR [Paenibacillus solanacearum]|uniref:Unsaturated rhamnogalacturonyl hydrolase YteR n=1 Tax=Paenibacillus solanacearum TaxID=2048548 RepID=A0A916K5Z4_9BACL|nr:glycoside hydrolase family 88 protein [Paenibacillus solanacearum]CAG7632520.1 Unsaturated rhamnogalacturonyl hydrolase YteR [Paenibacillus solanacearum]